MFYDRLKKECEKKGIKITNLLKELNISTSSGTAWKNGALPTGETLMKIKKRLNVSIDYLISGEEAEATENKTDELTQEILNHISEMNTIQKAKLLTEMTKEAEETAERKEKQSS